MANSREAFQILEADEQPPIGFTKITCHLIFDLKMDLTRKTIYVARGHLTDPPSSLNSAWRNPKYISKCEKIYFGAGNKW